MDTLILEWVYLARDSQSPVSIVHLAITHGVKYSSLAISFDVWRKHYCEQVIGIGRAPAVRLTIALNTSACAHMSRMNFRFNNPLTGEDTILQFNQYHTTV